MGLFQRSAKAEQAKPAKAGSDQLSEYVDSILEDNDAEPISKKTANLLHECTKYGIDEAISLMRRLPGHYSDIVITVRETLESANIDVSVIINDAKDKANTLNDQIAQLGDEIDELQAQIEAKKQQILDSETRLEETRSVKKLLEEGEKQAAQGGANKKNAVQLVGAEDKQPQQPKQNSNTDKQTRGEPMAVNAK